MKLFVQRPLRVSKFIGKMKKYFKNRLDLRLYVHIEICFMLDIPLVLILKDHS